MYSFYITGVVQGVGFRPYIFNACTKAGIHGYIQNTGTGVLIIADKKEAVEDILKTPPPLARIDKVVVTDTDERCSDFKIRKSAGEGSAEIPADLFLCNDCRAELHDKNNRRYGYFFITCTNCGPRFTMTKKSPYDRDTTTMDMFPMCTTCKEEYTDPTNRRYHAQTIACHDCGPRMELYHNNELQEKGTGKDIIQKTVALLQAGEVVAIKGVGGFHLVCTTHTAVVQKLKKITNRTDKPFALLCKDTEMIQSIAHVSNKEQELLESIERPIVVLKKKTLLSEVTELNSIGVMLPSTALHHLLFTHINEPLVFTSSNLSGEPITKSRDQQFVPWVLDHTRTIENVADDSLIKVIHDTPFYLRRSRGFVPRSFAVSDSQKPTILACGGEMNNTFALYKDGRVTPSQYIGNTSNPATFEQYKKMLTKFMQFVDVQPDIVCTDMHPDFNTSLFGIELAHELDTQHITVQHHVAHAYSIALEHNLTDFTAIICDGMGYGEDGTIWGGEIFHNDTHIGHLEQQLQLGGDSATQHPTKMA